MVRIHRIPRIMLGAGNTKIHKTKFLSSKSSQSIGGDKHSRKALHSCMVCANAEVCTQYRGSQIKK